MAIIRSRAVAADKRDPHRVSNPQVDQALAQWDQRLLAAREEGRLAGRREAEAQLAAERKKLKAEQAALVSENKRTTAAAAAATTAVQQRFQPLLQALGSGIDQIAVAERQAVEAGEHEMVRLALHIAATVLRREIQIDERWMDDVLRQALTLVPDRRGVALRMHPTDIECLRERLPGIAAGSGVISEIAVVPDPRLVRGSCIIESAGTEIDASLNRSLDDLAGVLLAVAPPRASGEPGEAIAIGDPAPAQAGSSAGPDVPDEASAEDSAVDMGAETPADDAEAAPRPTSEGDV
jgi:flagellar biosynthesis/type III secretory pathway protein FliH